MESNFFTTSDFFDSDLASSSSTDEFDNLFQRLLSSDSPDTSAESQQPAPDPCENTIEDVLEAIGKLFDFEPPEAVLSPATPQRPAENKMPDTSLNPDFLSVTDHEFWTNPNWSEGTWMEVAVTSPQNFFPSIMSSPAMSTLSPTLSAPSPDMSAPSPNTFISSPDSSIFSLNTSFYSPSPSMSISSPGMSISSPSMCMNSRQDISSPEISILSPETSYHEISSPEPSPNSNLSKKIRTPKVKRERTRVNNTKAPNIVHWTAQQVCDPRLNDIITWDSYEEGRFIIRDQKKLALLWGKSKGKNMDFANYSRALRYHYNNSKNKELVPVSKKLIYRFSEDFMNSFVRKLNN